MTVQAWVVDETTKGALDQKLKLVTVDPEKVRDALDRLRELLPEDEVPVDGRVQRWRMQQVQLSLEISAEGGVRLVGSATLGVKGSIDVTFTRVE